MNTAEAVVEAERVLEEAAERHSAAQARAVETTVALRKAMLDFGEAHNMHQIFLRKQSEQ